MEKHTAIPVRPATVPEQTQYADQSSINSRIACWVMGQTDSQTGKFVGDYAEWDLNGKPLVKRVYSLDTGEVIAEHEYQNGKLRTSNVKSGEESLQSFYHQDAEAPVLKSTTLYRNNYKDRLETYFDETGRELYSVRMEKVNEYHVRRYYNEVLVFEGIGNPDHSKAPESVKYFYKGGATLIDYASNGDGTGTWRIYDEAGKETATMPLSDEKETNKYNHWGRFLPTWAHYNGETTQTDWDAVIELVTTVDNTGNTRDKIYALIAPDYLKQELDKVDWEKIKTAITSGKKLPIAIPGLLTEDEDIVEMCLISIWGEIEFQGSIYEATYKVTAILARMLPYYTNVPVVKARLVEFLYKILGFQNITENEELYKELNDALNAIAPLLMILAAGEDELVALRCQYILIRFGRHLPETEALLIREHQRTENTLVRRAYAAMSLGYLYLNSKQEEKLIAHFSTLFPSEKTSLVRLVMAILLVVTSKHEAQEPWLAELIGVLVDPDSVDAAFYRLQPFIGDHDEQEYVLIILGHAKQEELENNMEGLIATLPEADSLKQVTLFQTIFKILFPNEEALEKITPIREKALLAAATVVDAQPNFVNHSEVFYDYGIPYDSYKLRQLAAKQADK